MTKKPILAIVLVGLAAIGVLLFIYPQRMISPGKLDPAHAELTTDCFACHNAFTGAAPERCIACHVVDKIGLFTTKGVPIVSTGLRAAFHQHLSQQNCMACHAGHAGTKVAGGGRSFSHELLDPAVRAQCGTCHRKPDDGLHRAFADNCSQCHSPAGWKPASFDHAKFFGLDSDHNVACTTCHLNNDTAHYTCYGCHEHTQAGIRAKHLREGIRDFTNCVQCHRSAHDKGRGRESGGGSGERDDD